MALSFGVRKVGDTTIIDWSMAGGEGCRPATQPEMELLSRITELEAKLEVAVAAAIRARGPAHPAQREGK